MPRDSTCARKGPAAEDLPTAPLPLGGGLGRLGLRHRWRGPLRHPRWGERSADRGDRDLLIVGLRGSVGGLGLAHGQLVDVGGVGGEGGNLLSSLGA
jgi:hypothetical protein